MKQSDYPALYQSASMLSEKAQKAFFRTFFAHIALLAIASAISVLNSSCSEIAILQALVLIGALGCAVYLFLVRPERQWYSGRAIAESVKTITWRYVMHAEPFDNPNDVARSKFLQRLQVIVKQNQEVVKLNTIPVEAVQVTEEMNSIRQKSIVQRIEYYRIHRVIDQLNWYVNKASANRKDVNLYFIILLISIGVSIFFVVAKVSHPDVAYWPTDFFVTVAAALLSWIQAKRFQDLAVSYSLAAHEISFIREQVELPIAASDFSKFVGDAENAFSREHAQWAARKDA